VLNSLRKYSTSVPVKILYGLLALSFLIWGVGAVGMSRVDVVAEVHGDRITRQQLDTETGMLQRRFEEMLKGATLPRSLDLRGRALDQLIDNALLRHEADRLGLEVGEGELVTAITAMPELQENGRFNRDLLERVLQLQRDRGEFEDQVRQDLINQRMRSLVVDGVQVSDAEVADRYKLDREQVDLTIAKVTATGQLETVTLTDDDLQKWLTDNAERYRTQPRVRVRYVAYSPKDFAAMAAPDDAAIQAYYDEHRDDRFTEQEQVRASHILIPLTPDADDAAKAAARKKADDILAKVNAGGDFAALAKENSGDPGSASKGGDLGFFPRGRMVGPFETAAFSLEPGKVSEIVETPFGFHIIRVDEKKAGGPRPLPEVRDQIVATLTEERGLDLAHKQADADRRQVVSGKPLAEAVGARTVQETAAFSATDEVPGVGRVKSFSDAAFALDLNQPSDIIEGDDVLFMLTPIERIEPSVPPLAEVRAKVETDAKRARAETLAKERAEKLRVRAQEIGLAKAAEELGITLEDTGTFERRAGSVPKVGMAPELRADAFSLTPEKPLGPRTYTAGGDALVVALKGRTPADMAGLDAEKAGLKEQLLTQKQQDALTTFMNQLKERALKDGALEVKADAAANSRS
jgi:peptidyl-prolyl cis-trans isomerase D